MAPTPKTSTSSLELGGALTIERAVELQQLLLDELPAGGGQLCLSDISEIDCAGLQLLLAAKRERPDLRLFAPSPAVAQLLSRLQLTALISD